LPSILRAGHTCEAIAPASSSGVIVDARDYYLVFYHCALAAQRYLLMSGWQFDSDVPLLRGSDREDAKHPVELLPFLKSLCNERPELRIYMLAWDYSLVYALEREWMQRLKFDWMTTDRIHFAFDDAHAVGASHHQKFVIVDDAIAFAGGIDLCHSRWDDRQHSLSNPDRLNRVGKASKPYHDCMGYCTGPAVEELTRLFCRRWERSGGEPLELPPPPRTIVPNPEPALNLQCRHIGLSVTQAKYREHDAVQQIRDLHEAAIAASQRLIYIESQYFTSRVVHRALADRMRASGPKLEIIIVTPHGADSPKEKFVLGNAQSWVLSSLASIARERGHALRVLYSAARGAEGDEVATFIHSKILCVDDRLLSIGSANCTNRSMSLDTELNLVWECSDDAQPLRDGIARVRASLLCEHAGVDYDATLERSSGIVQLLDGLIGASKLRAHELPESPLSVDQDPLLERAFDPDEPLTELELGKLLEPRHD
jgi:phospholipase D1/2